MSQSTGHKRLADILLSRNHYYSSYWMLPSFGVWKIRECIRVLWLFWRISDGQRMSSRNYNMMPIPLKEELLFYAENLLYRSTIDRAYLVTVSFFGIGTLSIDFECFRI